MMRAFMLTPLVALGGCISILPEPPPPPRIFALEPGEVAQVSTPRIEGVVAVAQPTGERAILGPDLIWRDGDELAYVAQTQWSTRAESALQSILVETLARQGAFRAATRMGEGRADYEIRWDVLDFQIAGDVMQARFAADVRVLQAPGRRILAQRIITAEAPVSDRSAGVSARALAQAARDGSAQIAAFAAEAASARESGVDQQIGAN
ncbi:MAG: ABC-type transport auxiliary lipoprotein family protein [Hyphomonadaceae bacterium]|nr:ABC-type transport auxiliary lipoprotein family protein [Hyphomonadaceae bacterium]